MYKKRMYKKRTYKKRTDPPGQPMAGQDRTRGRLGQSTDGWVSPRQAMQGSPRQAIAAQGRSEKTTFPRCGGGAVASIKQMTVESYYDILPVISPDVDYTHASQFLLNIQSYIIEGTISEYFNNLHSDFAVTRHFSCCKIYISNICYC